MRKQMHVWVKGRVQGVWFRGSTQRRALELGLVGWVRNRGDGSVEAVFQGELGQVERMMSWIEVGPPRAQVLDVKRVEEQVDSSLKGFQIN